MVLHTPEFGEPFLCRALGNSGILDAPMDALCPGWEYRTSGTLISASIFFGLAIAMAIALFGPDSDVALAGSLGIAAGANLQVCDPGFRLPACLRCHLL